MKNFHFPKGKASDSFSLESEEQLSRVIQRKDNYSSRRLVIKFAPRHPTEKCSKFVGVCVSLYGCFVCVASICVCVRMHNESVCVCAACAPEGSCSCYYGACVLYN